MKLSEALEGISQRRYYELCGYSYMTLKHGKHQDLKFKDLPPNMQYGVIELIHGIHRVQKMVYSYDIGFVDTCIKSCGIIRKPFYDSCDISKTFWKTRSLREDREGRLMCVRLQLIAMLNRLFRYVLE